MSTRRPSPPTVLPVSTEVSPSPVSVSSSTEVFTSVSTILPSQSSLVKVVPSWLPSSSVGPLLLFLVLLPTQLILSDVVWWWPLVLVSKLSRSKEHSINISVFNEYLRCPLQVLHRLRYANPQDWRFHVYDEGCWCQHSPWCCWCWCPLRCWRSQGYVHQVEKRPIILFDHTLIYTKPSLWI